MKKSILMLCYYFPPLVDVGCKRSVAFAKFFKKHDWQPHVLSVRNPDRQFCHLGSDRPPNGVPTEYTWSLFNLTWLFGKINGVLSRLLKVFGVELKRNYFHDLFSVPDIFIGWVPATILKGYSLIRERNIDYIYVSCSPFSSALTGMALKKLTRKPLIIDFRDPLAVNIPNIFGIPTLRRKVDFYIEKKIIRAADFFIVNTEEVRQGYLEQYREIGNKTFCIHNGFDDKLLSKEPREKFEKFTIVYAGNMYFHAIKSKTFFEALAWLKKREIVDSEDFQFLYFGHDKENVRRIAHELTIEDLVRVSSLIPYNEMLPIIQGSHLQLLRIVKPMISTKLFEGIALNIPFLATIPKGEVEDIIRKYSPSSYVVTEDSPEKIWEAIMQAMKAYRQGEIEDNFVSQFLEVYSRESLTSKLERVIEQEAYRGLSRGAETELST